MDLQGCIAEAQCDQWLPGQRLRTALTRGGFSIDEILAFNGNKPISSSATPLNRFVIERNCRERRTTKLQAPLNLTLHPTASAGKHYNSADHSGPAKLPITGGLGGPVYTLENELSIWNLLSGPAPDLSSPRGEFTLENRSSSLHRLLNPCGKLLRCHLRLNQPVSGRTPRALAHAERAP
jgi:hypothetical protein